MQFEFRFPSECGQNDLTELSVSSPMIKLTAVRERYKDVSRGGERGILSCDMNNLGPLNK